MSTANGFDAAVATLRDGGVIAYPTEAVWGLGCDPDDPAALQAVLTLKQRDPAKGLILIAGDIAQVAPWLEGISEAQRDTLLATWPGPNTWLVPDNGRAHPLLRGEHDRVALRVSDHPLVAALCAAHGGPIVSTSANPAGAEPARDLATVRRYFGESLAAVDGALGGQARPSRIRDLLTGDTLRA
ncbi:Sua5/YciO/YrdC/YwlC family protein [Modicisalibacter tunisiensis]|uniref:L-threonylcarbamoyladenylate synthase n=1 Tax=Modicisalibacter tunisiensis TaxID=390637 RepID=UPI001CCBB8E1|nr:Sua5/YciO/YrdC/YwlC family protein [Modicisalibacter tunisiensis]MBZ9538954.1 Sua5/YciO/YrdC/YwlC family protein [Modicisalibacter tunisiensis]